MGSLKGGANFMIFMISKNVKKERYHLTWVVRLVGHRETQKFKRMRTQQILV